MLEIRRLRAKDTSDHGFVHEPRALTQVPEIGRGAEPFAFLDESAVAVLERAGVRFIEETEFDEAGPTRWAAVRLSSGEELLLVHHHAHEGEVEVRSRRVSGATPAEVTLRLVDAAGLGGRAVTWVADRWI